MSRLATIPPDRVRDHPANSDVPMLDWWRGCYDHVFVALHPFYATPNDPDNPDVDLYAAAKAVAPTRWRDMADRVCEADFGRFALATLLAGCGMTSENRCDMTPVPDDRLIAELRRLCESERLAFPWDDSPSPMLETALGTAFSRLGAATVTGWSEFREESTDIAIADLLDPETPCASRLSHGVYAYLESGRRMLATASFDHIWTILALTDAARQSVRPEDRFEGFWAGPETTVNWVNEPGTYAPPAGWT